MRFLKLSLRYIFKFFFRGLIFLVPLGLTAWVVYYAYNLVRTYSFTDNPWLSVLMLLVGIILVGWLTSTLILRPLVKLAESFLLSTPLLKIIYTSIKDLLEAFVGEKKRFTKPALITLSRSENLRRIGFITAEDMEDLGLKDHVAVYIPMSYSFSGNLYIVPRDQLIPLHDVDSAEVMKFIVAGGVTDIKADEDNAADTVKRLLSRKDK